MSAPRFELEMYDANARGDGWMIFWRLHIRDRTTWTFTSVQAPHAKFRAKPLTLDVATADGVAFELETHIKADATHEIENAFVIVEASRGGERWRVLFRVRVEIPKFGIPDARVESTTTQRVGFSGES